MLSKKLFQFQPLTQPKPNQYSPSSLQGLLRQNKPKIKLEEIKINSKVTVSPKTKRTNDDTKSPSSSKTPSCPLPALIIKPITHIPLSQNKPALVPSSKPKISSRHKLKNQKKVVPAKPPNRIELEPCIAQVYTYRYESNEQITGVRDGVFDDATELYGFANSLLDCRIISFRIHYGGCGFGLMANDIQITYKNIVTGQTFQTKERKGGFNPLGYSTITLADGEFIVHAETANGQYLKVRTDKGNYKFVGGPDESTPSVFAIGDNVVVGAYSSGYGISGLGFYIAPRSELKYWRRPYILMKTWLAKNKDIRDQLEQERQEGKMQQLSLAAQAFFITATLMDGQIYKHILKYI